MTSNETSLPGADNNKGASAIGAVSALLALAIIALLAFPTVTVPTPADKATLLFLAVASAVCMLSPLRRALENNADAATFVLLAAFFIIYSVARRSGPDSGWELPLQSMKDSPIVLAWSARVAIGGALLSLALGRPRMTGPARAVLAALLSVSVVGVFIFKFLGHSYPVSILSVVNPELIVHTLLQAVEYASVALLCSTVCGHTATRHLALRALPVLLLLLWARHQFGPVAVEDDE